MIAPDLRRLRLDQGLTLAQVSRAAGTSAPNLSAYECGRKRPVRSTEERLLAVIRASADSPIHRHRLLTVPATAAALRQAIRTGWPTVDRLRLIREMRSNAHDLSSEADVDAFYARPSTTGDVRWDTLLAGVAELDAIDAGRPVPAWVADAHLDHLWFVGTMRAFDGYAMANTPPSLSVRGIALHRSDLESV